MFVCLLRVCVRVEAPERLGVGAEKNKKKEETLRFCAMNNLLRQAHPNALVPGVARGLGAPSRVGPAESMIHA
jgi:hypothetical protein